VCGLEFPDIEALYQQYSGDGFVPLGIAADAMESEELLDAFVEQTGLTFTVAWDGDTYNGWAWPASISPYPRQALVGKDGTVRYLAAEHQATALEQAIVAALAE
jgi:hypothetical protein